MKKRIITFVTALSFVFITAITVQAFVTNSTISASQASATFDNRPELTNIAWNGVYVAKDINGMTKSEKVYQSANRVQIYGTWYPPTSHQSKYISLDCFVNGRFVTKIYKER